jgi:hypothetical protein
LDQRILGGISQERILVGIFPIIAFGTQESSIGKVKESFIRPCFHRKTAGIRTLAQSLFFLSFALIEVNELGSQGLVCWYRAINQAPR